MQSGMPTAVFPKVGGGSGLKTTTGWIVWPHPWGIHKQLRVERSEKCTGVWGVHHPLARGCDANRASERPPKIGVGAFCWIQLCLGQKYGQTLFVHGIDPSEWHQPARPSGFRFVVRFPSEAQIPRWKP